MTSIENKNLANKIENLLDLKTAKLSKSYYYNNLVLCVIDSIFSIGIKYTTVEKIVENFSNHFKISKFRDNLISIETLNENMSINEFILNYESLGEKYFCENIFKNKNLTSSSNGILKSHCTYLVCKVLQSFNINGFNDFQKIIKDKNFEKAFKNIRGQSSGISLSYLYMLAGSDNFIKPDRMIQRFLLKELNIKSISLLECEIKLNQAFEILKLSYPSLTLRLLDHEIWKFEKNRK